MFVTQVVTAVEKLPEDLWLAVYGGRAASCDIERWNFLAIMALAGMQLTRSLVTPRGRKKLLMFDVGLYNFYCEQGTGQGKGLAIAYFISGVADACRGVTFNNIEKVARQIAGVEEDQFPSLYEYAKAAILTGRGGLKEAVEVRDEIRAKRKATYGELGFWFNPTPPLLCCSLFKLGACERRSTEVASHDDPD